MDELKGASICMTQLREIVCEVNCLATVVARSIQSCPVLAWEKISLVLCYTFLLSKGVSHALFVLALSSNPVIFIGWKLTVYLNLTFCADY